MAVARADEPVLSFVDADRQCAPAPSAAAKKVARVAGGKRFDRQEVMQTRQRGLMLASEVFVAHDEVGMTPFQDLVGFNDLSVSARRLRKFS
jgi:hypothetical protein